MESYIAEINFDAMAEIEQAYWNLADPALICAPNFQSPEMSQIWSGKFAVIVCRDDNEIVGLMCIKAEDHGVYYPVMRGDYVEILRSMVLCAREEFGTLTATTDNRLIHETALNMGIDEVVSEGNKIWWNK